MLTPEDRQRSLDGNMSHVLRDRESRNVLRRIVFGAGGMGVFTANTEAQPVYEGIRTLQLEILSWAQEVDPENSALMIAEHFKESREKEKEE